jgi:hypothetical protein
MKVFIERQGVHGADFHAYATLIAVFP